eukprot:s692_g14.t1
MFGHRGSGGFPIHPVLCGSFVAGWHCCFTAPWKTSREMPQSAKVLGRVPKGNNTAKVIHKNQLIVNLWRRRRATLLRATEPAQENLTKLELLMWKSLQSFGPRTTLECGRAAPYLSASSTKVGGALDVRRRDGVDIGPTIVLGFLHERQAFSCPVSRVEEPGSGVEGIAPKASSETAHDKSTAAPQASETRSHEAEESDCSTVDTGSLREVPHTPEMEPAHAFPMQMSLTGLLSQAASSSSEVLTPLTPEPMATSSSFFSSMAGYAAPFSPGAGAYYDMGLHQPLQTFENLHQEFLATDFEYPLPQPVPPSPVPHAVPPGATGPLPSPVGAVGPLAPVGPVGQLPGPAPAVPPPCEPAPQVPPARLPQVPSHAATQQNGSAPQVLKLEDALAPAASVALESANSALEEQSRNQHLEVQQAAAVAAAQAVSASHEEQVLYGIGLARRRLLHYILDFAYFSEVVYVVLWLLSLTSPIS